MSSEQSTESATADVPPTAPWGTPPVDAPTDGPPRPETPPPPPLIIAAAPPPTTRRTALRPVLIAMLVLASLAAVLLVRNAWTTTSATAPTSRRVAEWPTAGPSSPATPPGHTEWAGTAPPDSSADDGTSTGGPTSTSAPASAGSAAATANDAFCGAVGSGAQSLGGGAVSALKSLALRGGDAAPAARSFVEQAVNQVQRLKDTAPAALTDAVGTLANAWSSLASDLDRAGYGRMELVTLGIKYFTNPAVALAWETLARWSTQHCGVNLLDGRSAAG